MSDSQYAALGRDTRLLVPTEDEAKTVLHGRRDRSATRPDLVTIRKKDENNTFAIGKLSLCDRLCIAVQRACALSEYDCADAAKASSIVGQWVFALILGYMTAAAVEYQDDAMEAHEAGLVFQCSCQAGCGTVSNGVHNSSVCQNSEMTTQLPGKEVVYLAAGVFGICNFLEGVFSFLAARNYAKHKTSLDQKYGAIKHATKGKLELPNILWGDFDYWRMWETVFGFMVVGLGNWLVAKDHITYGLFTSTIGAMLIGNGIIGWAESKLAVLRCGQEFFQKLLAMEAMKAALEQDEREQFEAELAEMEETLRGANLHA